MQDKIKKVSLFFILLTLFFSAAPQDVKSSHTDHVFPKRANYFLWWQINDSQARELAKWDLLILDMELQISSKRQLDIIRAINPDIKILAYIASEEIERTAPISGSFMRQKLAARIDPRWYAVDTNRQRKNFWPGTYILNMSADAPTIEGKKMNKVMAEFVANEILGTGLWDGVLYDNAFDSITWVTGSKTDFNLDGLPDLNPDAAWREGMKFLYDETRRLTLDKYLIVANGLAQSYHDHLDGQMVENFAGHDWQEAMRLYARKGNPHPRINIINNNTLNRGGESDYKNMRFGLASSLMADGYYSYDFGDTDHGQLWYYDEYDIDLGPADGQARSLGGLNDFSADVWRRDFDHGIALVNSLSAQKTVPLEGEFEAILGSQDRSANNGAIITELDLQSKDGRILLKTLDKLKDVFFENGDFVRFLHTDGERARNGFFVFDENFAGGTKLARIDFTGDGLRELVVAKGNKLEVYRDDGQLYMRAYPYTANYKGELNLAAGDITGNGKTEILVAPSAGFTAPIKIYTRHGISLNTDWYPFGINYSGGFNLATADLFGYGRDEIVLGSGLGVAPRVRIYRFHSRDSYRLLHDWAAFENSFTGGLNVAAGNFDTDFADEIVVGSGPGKLPVVRLFKADGSLIGSEIMPYKTTARGGIKVGVVDVDFDGIDDIVAMSGGI